MVNSDVLKERKTDHCAGSDDGDSDNDKGGADSDDDSDWN